MKTLRCLIALAAVLAAGLVPRISAATPTVYADLTDFQTARNNFISGASAGGIGLRLDDFDDVPEGSNSIPSLSRTDVTVTYTHNIRTEKPLFNQSGTVNLTGGIAWDYAAAVNTGSLTFTFNSPINAFAST